MNIKNKLYMSAKLSIILVVIGISVGGCQKKQEKPEEIKKITLGVETSLLPSAVWVAENKGYFERQGLDLTIKEFDSGRTALATMLNEGNLDMVTVAQTPVMFNSFDRDDYVIIATMVYLITMLKYLPGRIEG